MPELAAELNEERNEFSKEFYELRKEIRLYFKWLVAIIILTESLQ
ncbi:MAG TPA: hypothetical protein ACFYD3_01550 [Candidatus Hypogeohydataceae bacterium YC41]